MTNLVAIDLEELDVRDGWILESRIYQLDGLEIRPLQIQPLMSHILNIACSHNFLCSVEIMQKSSSGGVG